MKVITSERVPIKAWSDDLDDATLAQARNLANLPFAFKHIAIMPDGHLGYGMPIGGVLASKWCIVPNAVGVDIGCGMCAVRTSLRELGANTLKLIMGDIREAVPVGFSHNADPQDEALMPGEPLGDITQQQYEAALHQLGTLGGGNHFIEVQQGSDERVWLMVHSGSRNLGFKVANYYNKVAKALNENWCTSVPKEHDLAFLPFVSPEGQAYHEEMQYCVEFARANRALILDRVSGAVYARTGAEFDSPLDVAHNYAAIENHYGKNVVVHRKGATRARLDEVGIIPGSQGTASYIVLGRGNPLSFMSCSHGAGRAMGRRQARDTLNLQEEQKRLDEQGILHSIHGRHELDEAPGAYKDIDKVMEDQKDLVRIVTKLTPLGVVKG